VLSDPPHVLTGGATAYCVWAREDAPAGDHLPLILLSSDLVSAPTIGIGCASFKPENPPLGADDSDAVNSSQQMERTRCRCVPCGAVPACGSQLSCSLTTTPQHHVWSPLLLCAALHAPVSCIATSQLPRPHGCSPAARSCCCRHSAITTSSSSTCW
jgi:hypothetical protein